MKRQGDLLIVRIQKIPSGAGRQESRVLAEGEVTGHFHELDSGEVYEHHGTLYFRVPEGEETLLTHQEHGRVRFEPGIYKVVRQREYEPAKVRYVTD